MYNQPGHRVCSSTCLTLVVVVSVCLLVSSVPFPLQAQSSQRCFDETNLCISGRIRTFWEENGGLPVFGLPITPQQEEVIEGQTLEVQWFERNRLELHPENQPPYDVLLGRLGVDRLEQQGRDWKTFSQSNGEEAGCRFFGETGQNVCGPILTAWRANGLETDGQPGKTEAENLALFGLPISPAQIETLGDGNQYAVQWFERARFELHPENVPPYNVLLGLLGKEIRSEAGGQVASLSLGVQGEDYRFDSETLGPVVPGQSATLSFQNTSTVYQHNWILLNTSSEDVAREFDEQAAMVGPANDYMPTDQSLVLAHSRLLNPQESDAVAFRAPGSPGTYIYLCTVPGHFTAGMKGILTVSP